MAMEPKPAPGPEWPGMVPNSEGFTTSARMGFAAEGGRDGW
jgi:hypothetical protein